MLAALALPALAGQVIDAEGNAGWKILDRVTLPNGGVNFATNHPDKISGGGLSFQLPAESDGYTSYMLANYNGDLTEKTITATVHVERTAGTTYEANPSVCGGGTPTVRLEFQRTSAGGYVETDYW